MQNRYTGDIGDFGKLGILRALQLSGLSVGVNWYLVPNERHNDDGRYVQYLENAVFRQCDETLWSELKRIVNSGQREVSAIQNAHLIDAVFFSKRLSFSGMTKKERASYREKWHWEALSTLSGVNIVFVDPDNGLLVPSATGTSKENKYVTPTELADYYRQGSSVVYYQHKARVPDSVYIERHRELIVSSGFEGASGLGLKFNKTSLRYYFFVIQPQHKAVIAKAVDQMLASSWSNYFTFICSH